VLGVSFDTVAGNKAFAEKFDFNFPLLCDTTKAMSTAYGACADASAKYPARITYIIDADGHIEHAEKVGDIEAHIHSAVARLNDG
jgi:peroxiredoxin Q/BCP